MNLFKRKNAQSAVFRKWENSGYAIFRSLKKVIKIGFLASVYLVFANPESTFAQNDSSNVYKNIDLESVDVNAEELPNAYSNISRVVATITRSEIERAAVSSINELIELASNIDIRQRGTNGIQADISVRGGTFDQVLVLLNGINLTDPQTGHHNLNLPIDFSAIERIEVLKGPGAWKFGPGAFSGAINIITLKPKTGFVEAEITGAQYETYTGKILSSFNTKKIKHLVSANHAQSEGYTNNTDYKLNNLFYKADLEEKNNSISFQTGFTNREFGANSFYSPKYPNQFEALETFFAALSSTSKINNIIIEPKFYFRRNNDHFLLFRDHPEWYQNLHTNEVLGGNILGTIVHGTSATTTFGVDFRNENIWSNNLGELTDNPVPAHQNDTILLDRFHKRSNLSSFIGHKHYFEKLMVNAGLNLTHNIDLEKWYLFPGIDASYQISNKLALQASANKTMRMPTYTDLYYQGPSNEGNPALLPEEAVGYDFGAKYKSNGIELSATGFYTKGTNMIDWVKEKTADKWKTVNHACINTTGIEWSSKLDFEKLMPDQQLLTSLTLNYTFINQKQLETNLISNYSLNYLKHRLDVGLSHSIAKNLYANWHLGIQDRNGQFEKFAEEPYIDEADQIEKTRIASQGLIDFSPFASLDVKIWYRIKGWRTFVEATNLFNIEYFDYGNVPQPGRWIKLGLSKKIEFKR